MLFPRPLLLAARWFSVLALAGPGTLAAATPRVATVNATEVFTNYYRTKAEKAKLAEAQRALGTDPRTAVIAQTLNELRALEAQVRDESNSEQSREEYFRKYQMKSHELRSLQRDTEQNRRERQQKINEQLVQTSKILLVEIQSTVQRIAATDGYDMVIDIGGDTSSQVPTLLYIRDGTDITARVLEELNRTKPADLPPGVTATPPRPRPLAPDPALMHVPVPAPPPPPAPAPALTPDPAPIPRAVPLEEDDVPN